jgi:hypothetical protein
MALIILAAVMVLAIAFYQVVQGVFSALIMAVLTVLSAMFAFAVYPMLAELLYTTQPGYAKAIALMATFVLPLLGLRMLFDRFIPGNVVLGVWPDRIFGGAMGLVTGIFITGMLAIAVQMLPFGASVMSYRPFNDALQRSSALAPFYCDELVVGAVGALSNGSLSTARKFEDVHDNLLLEEFCVRNTGGCNGSNIALPDALKSVEFYAAPEPRLALWRKDVPPNPLLEPGEVQSIIIVRCDVASSAADNPGEGDAHRRWRLPATQFRLVTDAERSCYPVAYLTCDAGLWAARPAPMQEEAETSGAGEQPLPQVGKLIVARLLMETDQSLKVDWVYRIPQGEKPRYVVFRGTSSKAPTAQQNFIDQPRTPPVSGALNSVAPREDQ